MTGLNITFYDTEQLSYYDRQYFLKYLKKRDEKFKEKLKKNNGI